MCKYLGNGCGLVSFLKKVSWVNNQVYTDDYVESYRKFGDLKKTITGLRIQTCKKGRKEKEILRPNIIYKKFIIKYSKTF